MKQKFSTKWKASSQPRKQRKYRANAPLHLKKKFVSVNLAKPLRAKLGKRNVVVKKDDKVKIMRGKYKGKQGKILEVKLKMGKVIVEGIQVTKADGSKANVKLQPSNLQIIEMAERGKTKNFSENMKIKDKVKIEHKKAETKEVKKAESKTKDKEKKK